MEKAEAGVAISPEVRWVKTSGSDALQPLDRHWIRYVRIVLLLAAVLITWRILAWQDDGYGDAAAEAGAFHSVQFLPVGESRTGLQTSEQKNSFSDTPIVTPESSSALASTKVVAPTPTTVQTSAPTPVPTQTLLVHRVKPGDTISGISQFYDVSVTVILELNGISDVDNIFVGQELRLPPDARLPPAATVPTTYRVQSGDTLSAIAVKFGVSIEDLLAANGMDDPNSIFEGQEIRLSSGT